jgi:TRAP transporter TAXI family solute receptor
MLSSSHLGAADWKPEIKFFKIGCGSSGGTWYPQGAIIAEAINKDLAPLSASVAPGGAVSNVWKLNRNELQMAMTYMYLEGLAWDGKEPFENENRNIRHLVSMVPYALTFVVRADSDIKRIEDLKDKKIVVGQKGFISELLARVVLEAHGITYDQIVKNGGLVSYLSYKEGAELLQDKHTDMFVLMAIHPSSLLMGLSTQTPIRFLGIEKQKLAKILKENKGLIEMTVPDKAGTYGMQQLVPAIGGVYGFLVNKDISDELAYRVTKILYERIPQMADAVSKELGTVTVEGMDRAAAIPLHPGAERYMKEHRK